MGQNRAQRQIFQKTKVKFRLKNGPRIGVLEPKIGQKQQKKKKKKKIGKKFELKAKTGAKNTNKQDYFKPELEFWSKKLAKNNQKRKKNSKKV